MGMKEALGKVWDELERPGKQGTAELANTLFNGQAFVPYGEGQRSADIQKDEPTHGLPPEAQKQPEQQKEQGMEMEM